MSAPLRAEALVETERDGSVTHEVHVTLTEVEWRQLVGDIAARILWLSSNHSPIIPKLYAAGVRPCDADQQEALTELVEMLNGRTHIGSEHHLPPTFTASTDDTLDLVGALVTASLEPRTCACGRAIPQPSQLTDECDLCDERRPLRIVRGAP